MHFGLTGRVWSVWEQQAMSLEGPSQTREQLGVEVQLVGGAEGFKQGTKTKARGFLGMYLGAAARID